MEKFAPVSPFSWFAFQHSQTVPETHTRQLLFKAVPKRWVMLKSLAKIGYFLGWTWPTDWSLWQERRTSCQGHSRRLSSLSSTVIRAWKSLGVLPSVIVYLFMLWIMGCNALLELGSTKSSLLLCTSKTGSASHMTLMFREHFSRLSLWFAAHQTGLLQARKSKCGASNFGRHCALRSFSWWRAKVKRSNALNTQLGAVTWLMESPETPSGRACIPDAPRSGEPDVSQSRGVWLTAAWA